MISRHISCRKLYYHIRVFFVFLLITVLIVALSADLLITGSGVEDEGRLCTIICLLYIVATIGIQGVWLAIDLSLWFLRWEAAKGSEWRITHEPRVATN